MKDIYELNGEKENLSAINFRVVKKLTQNPREANVT